MMIRSIDAQGRRVRRGPTKEEQELYAMLTAGQQDLQGQQQQPPLWQTLPGLRLPPGHRVRAPAPQDEPMGIMGGQGQGPAERWEQVPMCVQLMDEICEAINIGSDFAF